MSKSKLELLLERAKSMAKSIEEPRDRDSWRFSDIDTIGEAAMILHEKGLNIIDPGTDIDLLWESIFCKIYSSLLYFRGDFFTCWCVNEKLVKIESKLANASNYSIALAKAAASASLYSKFQANDNLTRENASTRADKLFARSIAISSNIESTEPVFCGMTAKSYCLYEASRHYFNFNLKPISALLLTKAASITPYACYRSALGQEAPLFWKELYSNRAWIEFASKIIDKTHIDIEGYNDIFES